MNERTEIGKLEFTKGQAMMWSDSGLQPLVYHGSPFLEFNIGGGINRFVELLPKNCWVCIRDADTLFLTPRQQKHIYEIAEATDYDLIGCKTNRLGPKSTQQLYDGTISNESDIRKHIEIAERLEQEHWCDIELATYMLAGTLMLFRKPLWEAIGGFEENSLRFDAEFSHRANAQGFKVGVATGLYVFHLYRFNAEDPHLTNWHLFTPLDR